MAQNELTSLEDYSFNNLQSLRSLILRVNLISHIAVDSFHGLVTLDHLDLVHNRITQIDLHDLPLGALIWLDRNPLTSIDNITGFPLSTHSMYDYKIDKSIGKMVPM